MNQSYPFNPTETQLTLLVITFDQGIDTTTLTESTFSLTYPAPTQIINAQQLITGPPGPSTVSLSGTWLFATDAQNRTVATFTPEKPFQQNTVYTVMLLGADASLTTEVLKNTAGEALAQSYQWVFTTGVLNLQTPPPTSPLLVPHPVIDPQGIRVQPRRRLNTDLTQRSSRSSSPAPSTPTRLLSRTC